MGEHIAPGVNAGEIVKDVFKEYRADFGKSDEYSTKAILKDVTAWTKVEFTNNVFDDLKRLGVGTGKHSHRAWAILYCLRFMEDPDKTGSDNKWPSALSYVENIERLILLPNKRGQRTYRSINNGKGPPHPEDPHPKEPATPDPNRLPARFFVPHLPEIHQGGREEFKEVHAALIERKARRVALVAAVTGPGGYGKTAIAEEIANDLSVRRAFPGGIYWLQFGLRFGGGENEAQGFITTQEAISDLLERQYADSETNHFDLSTPEKLFEALPDDRLLVIADDIWNSEQASIQSSLPDRVTVLTTTRSQAIAKSAAHSVKVERLAEAAAFAILTHDMEKLTELQDAKLCELSKKFQGWPLLLRLANGHFRALRDEGGSIEDAIEEYEEVLASGNVVGWDNPEPGLDRQQSQRRKLAGLCIETGLSAVLSSEQRRLFEALAVFPDDTDIPFDAVDLLWGTLSEDRKRNKQVRPSALRLRAHNYSLFRELDAQKKTFRLHDEMLHYLRGNHATNELNWLHGEMVRAISQSCLGEWSNLPSEHKYAWKYLLAHMEQCDRTEEADTLRLSLIWLTRSLEVLGGSGMQQALSWRGIGSDAQTVLRVLRLAGRLLDEAPYSLFHELYGRLSHESSARLNSLARDALNHSRCWPHPRLPHLSAVGAEIVRFTDHDGPVNHAILDHNSTQVFTASADGMVRRWSVETGNLLAIYKGHQAAVNSVAVDQIGQNLVTSSADCTARLWCAKSDEEIQLFEGHRAAVTASIIDLKFEHVFTTSIDGTTRMWCMRSGKEVAQFDGECSSLENSFFQGSERHLVTVSGDCAYIWTTNPNVSPIELVGHTDQIETAVFSSDGKKVLTASWDGSARIWSSETGEQLNIIQNEGYDLFGAVFNPDHTHILTSSILHTLEYWSIESNTRVCGTGGSFPTRLGSNLFDDTSRYTLAIRNKNILCINSIESGNEVATIRKHHSKINSATFDRSGAKLLTASNDGTARLWSKSKAIEEGSQSRQEFRIWNANYHPSANLLAVACSDNLVRIIEQGDLREQKSIGRKAPSFKDEGLLDVAFDATGDFLLTSAASGEISIWSVNSGLQLRNFRRQDSWVKTARFSFDNRKIVFACGDGKIGIWDSLEGAEISKRKTHHGEVLSAVFSPDGSQVLSAHRGKIVRIWSATDFTEIQSFVGHDLWVQSAVFDRRGQRVLTASGDGTARLWSVADGKQIQCFNGHIAEVRSAVFDISETFVLTASDDRTVRIWATNTGQELRRIRFDEPVKFIAMSSKTFTVGCGGERLFSFDLIQ